MMTKQEIFELIRDNPVFHLASLDGGQPRVRALYLYSADERGIVFHTGTMKDVYRQLKANPRTELCFFDQKGGTQVRVAGEAELVEDVELKKEIVSHPTRKFLKPWIEKQGYGTLAVFRVKNGVATTWTMATNFTPKDAVPL